MAKAKEVYTTLQWLNESGLAEWPRKVVLMHVEGLQMQGKIEEILAHKAKAGDICTIVVLVSYTGVESNDPKTVKALVESPYWAETFDQYRRGISVFSPATWMVRTVGQGPISSLRHIMAITLSTEMGSPEIIDSAMCQWHTSLVTPGEFRSLKIAF